MTTTETAISPKKQAAIARLKTLHSVTEWQAGDKHRLYVNDLPHWYGLRCTSYNSGNIASATLWGAPISNSEARKIAGRLTWSKVYYDLTTYQWRGERIDQADLTQIVAALRAAANTPAPDERNPR